MKDKKLNICVFCIMVFGMMLLLSCGKKELKLVTVEDSKEEELHTVDADSNGAGAVGSDDASVAGSAGTGVVGSDDAGGVGSAGTGGGDGGSTSGDATQVTGEEGMYVFIYGAVKKPGVYEIQKGARLYELVSLAGGLSQEAAIGYNNLAREIVDGEQIYVPTEEEVKGGQGAGGVVGAGDGGVVGVGDGGVVGVGAGGVVGVGAGGVSEDGKLVNINSATREELMTLSGIGESRANDIISYRNQYGPFRSIEEIQNVSGIKTGIYEKIKDYITV